MRYNNICKDKLKEMCEHYKIDFNLCHPKTIKGEDKMLGVWDYEGQYDFFKTLGSKRYMYINDKGLSLTISGLNKYEASPYLSLGWSCEIKSHEYNFNPLDKFDDNMHIPMDYTGKLTHTYIDEGYRMDVVDYQNNVCEVSELSYIHLSKQDFNLSISKSFLEYLNAFRIDTQI